MCLARPFSNSRTNYREIRPLQPQTVEERSPVRANFDSGTACEIHRDLDRRRDTHNRLTDRQWPVIITVCDGHLQA